MDEQIIVLIFGVLRTRDVLSFSCVSRDHSRIVNLDCVLRSILLAHNISNVLESYPPQRPALLVKPECRYVDFVKLILTSSTVFKPKIITLKSSFLLDVKKRILPLDWVTDGAWREWRSYSAKDEWGVQVLRLPNAIFLLIKLASYIH